MQQQNLFPSDPYREAMEAIPGLQYIRDFTGLEEGKQLLQDIDGSPWLDDLKRRVQHYGYKYDYKRRSIDMSMHIGALPAWSMRIANRLQDEGLMPCLPDQLIVNEYLPGQGISNHVDCEPCFGDVIVSLSLGSPYVMNFTRKGPEKMVIPLLLESRSLIVLSGAARYDWMHGIKGVQNEKWQGQKFPRTRRVSLTFRKTILQ